MRASRASEYRAEAAVRFEYRAGAAVRCESCLPTFDGEKEQELFRELEGAVKPGLQQVSKLPLTASNSTFMALSSNRNSMERCVRASLSKASGAFFLFYFFFTREHILNSLETA